MLESSYLCRTCTEISIKLSCLFVFIYDIIVILSGVWQSLGQTQLKDPEGAPNAATSIVFDRSS